MSRIEQPTILVIVGISGDLAKRKLLPAIREIAKAGVLPNSFHIVGTSRRDLRLGDIVPAGEIDFWKDLLSLHRMDITDAKAFSALDKLLASIESSFSTPAQRLFYLSVPPQVAQPVVTLLGTSGIAKNGKLLLEKPFGTDVIAARDLIEHLKAHFKEEQIYRIDHYAAKEMAQNLTIFRGSNSLFKRTWNSEFIESIDILAAETIGIEGRAAFYEQTGALRDFVQSHLLQLVALVLMELPKQSDWQVIPTMRLRALQAIDPVQGIRGSVLRGQYSGYRDEVGNPNSTTETFVSLTLFSHDPTWVGVPITITTGKALDHKTTEIRIRYRQEDASEANELTLHIQPNEGAEICLWAKKPGYDREVRKLSLDFSYKQHFDGLPEAYERVFVDAMRSDHSLFSTSDEVLASWRILEHIQQAWAMHGDDLIVYPPGSTPQAVIQSK